MGEGINLAFDDEEDAKMMENFRDQLLVALVKMYGPIVTVPVREVDDTGGYILLVRADQERREFYLELRGKQ